MCSLKSAIFPLGAALGTKRAVGMLSPVAGLLINNKKRKPPLERPLASSIETGV